MEAGTAPDTTVLRAYLEHFLPGDVVGPVLVVFSLEGVRRCFDLYVPEEYATSGWGILFVLTITLVSYWGTIDETAAGELQDRIKQIEESTDG